MDDGEGRSPAEESNLRPAHSRERGVARWLRLGRRWDCSRIDFEGWEEVAEGKLERQRRTSLEEGPQDEGSYLRRGQAVIASSQGRGSPCSDCSTQHFASAGAVDCWLILSVIEGRSCWKHERRLEEGQEDPVESKEFGFSID